MHLLPLTPLAPRADRLQDISQREAALRRQHELVEREAKASARRVLSAEKAVTERDFNKSLNEQLMRNQEALRQRLQESERREAELAAKANDMEEQLRDMTFHFESQIKILQVHAPPLDSGLDLPPDFFRPPMIAHDCS